MYSVTVILFFLSAHAFAEELLPEEKEDMHPSLPLSSLQIDPAQASSKFWLDNAQKTVAQIVNKKPNTNVAKNVILFLGDGMSIPTIAAARVYNGGEDTQLAFDKFPYTAIAKTYAVDKQVPDSANTATAYLCGVKANYGTVGVGPEIPRGNCLAMLNTTNHAHSIAYHSQRRNKRTGLVTTARVTHASPAGVYAHTANRDWESDKDVGKDDQDAATCLDIATQLLTGDTGRYLNVVLGGGRKKFLPKDVKDEEGHKGERKDGKNLIQQWVQTRQNAAYVWNRDQLLAIDGVDNLLGLFGHTHLDYNIDRKTDKDPSLAEMTEAAIRLLNKTQDGYFLFVEGARIDMAHHDTEAKIALDETIEFSKAVQRAVDLTNEQDTLIVVTSDHAHTMSFGGYAARGHDVLEFAGVASDDEVYTTLSYANGPGYQKRHDITKDDYTDDHYQFPAVAPLKSETHGGDDVAVFAQGPWSHLFTGVIEQNVIPHLLAYASCVGDGYTACD